MNYKRIYDEIVLRAKQEVRDKKIGYYERHHIIPSSLGGSNKKENLVYLTAREHFICHLLLVKIYARDTNNYRRMLHAFMLMRGQNNHQLRYINGKLYENFKLQFADMRSKARAGVKLSADQKKKISEKMIGHEVSKETRKKISDKAKTRIRKPFSEEYKKRHSEIMKARHRWNTPL